MITRRALLVFLSAQGLALRAGAVARRATLLLGVPPGSSPDGLARSIIPFILRQWPTVEIVPRNVPGEGGLQALNALGDAPPSGATMGWVTSPSLAARMVDRGGEGILSRVTLVGSILREPIAFVSPAGAPLDSVQDIIRRASEDADAVPIGTPPPGSPPHLAALRLQLAAQTRLNIVTFPSGLAARQAVLSGNVSAAALGLTEVISALRDGRLHGVGLAARNRFGMLPDMPVLNEAGVQLSASIRRGLALPAGTPDEVRLQIAEVLLGVVNDPAYRGHADERGFVPAWNDGKAWARTVEAERTDLAALWRTDPWLPSSSG